MAVEVWRCDIARILKDYEEIDFLDMDVQGEEARIVAGGIEQMNQKVKLLFIGTHGSELEFELKQVLWTNGWILIRDYPWHQVSPTPFGEVSFDDGVQTCRRAARRGRRQARWKWSRAALEVRPHARAPHGIHGQACHV